MERYDGWTPKPELNDRWARLTERLGPGGKGYPGVTFTRLTAGLAGASALRQPPAPGEDTDERAAWVTGQAVNYLSGQDVDSKDNRTISSTSSSVSGSKYRRLLVSKSVDTVSGLQFTIIVSKPDSRRASAA